MASDDALSATVDAGLRARGWEPTDDDVRIITEPEIEPAREPATGEHPASSATTSSMADASPDAATAAARVSSDRQPPHHTAFVLTEAPAEVASVTADSAAPASARAPEGETAPSPAGALNGHHADADEAAMLRAEEPEFTSSHTADGEGGTDEAADALGETPVAAPQAAPITTPLAASEIEASAPSPATPPAELGPVDDIGPSTEARAPARAPEHVAEDRAGGSDDLADVDREPGKHAPGRVPVAQEWKAAVAEAASPPVESPDLTEPIDRTERIERIAAVSDRPTTPLLPDLPDGAQPTLVGRIEAIRAGIEELVEALGEVGAGTSLPQERLRAVIAEAPDTTVREWLRSLLYLGRVVAPQCRQALRHDDVIGARPLVAEIVQATPAVAGAVRASILLAGARPEAGDAWGEEAVMSAAPVLRRALPVERVARCLAHLLNDLTALETWLGAAPGSNAVRPWVPPAWPVAQRGRVTPGPAHSQVTPSRLTPSLARPHMPSTASLPPLPPEPWPRPIRRWDTADQWRFQSGALPAQRQLAAPAATRMAPPTQTYVERCRGEWSDFAKADRRAFAAAVVLALLLLTVAVWVWLLRPGVADVNGSPNGVAALVTAAVPTATIAPTATPEPTATPQPTATPKPPATPAPPPVTPTVSSLTLVCGTPGVPLRLHNSASSPQSWTIALPPGVQSDALRGVINPGKIYTIDLWAVAGTHAGTATAYLNSGNQRSPIRLTLPSC